MTLRHALIAAAVAASLAACSKPAETPAPAAEPAPATEPAPTPAAEPAPTAEPAPAATPAPATGAAAVVADCATTLDANDAMQYNAASIAVPASCAKFTINLKHVGKMPVAAMGHNVVVAKEADASGIVADGMAVTPDHFKAGDSRVIAATKMIGGGETASVSFDTAKIKEGGPFQFFCTFPGHYALMKGTISVQ